MGLIFIYLRQMENYSVILFTLAVMIGLSAVAGKTKIPYPVLLVIVGMAVGFVPALPKLELDPEVIFLIFLPPMLYDAAYNISPKEFRTNFNTITTLAISLVFITVIGIAVVAYYCIPGMTWPLSFVLGAILSATDAVAAMSATKGLGLSHKTITILEGESLINDASALIAYRFALAAVAGTSFVLWKASWGFVVLLAGGFLCGFIIARVTSYFLLRVQHNHMVVISLMLIMPFVTYSAAEQVHVSGVIAVVTMGLSIARFTDKVFPETLKQQSKSIWEIILFLLNGLVFILIGLQFPLVVKNIDHQHFLPYIGYSVLIWLITLILRTARTFMQQANLQNAFRKGKGRISEHALLDFKNSIVISWSGMRGIVSLAIAIALPTTLSDGNIFPQRDAIIFISVMVVLLTLIVQGLTLPMVVKVLKKSESPDNSIEKTID